MPTLARAAIALVWLYHGLWCKVLGRCPEQAAIVAAVPGLEAGLAVWAVRALGLGETALAAWVLSGRAPRLAALVQTVLLVLMNGGGLVWGRAHIADPGAMIVQNLAFLALVWLVADSPRASDHETPAATAWAAGGFARGGGAPVLLFGRMHEDWTIDAETLAAGTRVFCIASAGCTAMALAARGCEVVAVDVNPAQVAYVRERLAGAPMREGEADARLARWRRIQFLVGWTGLLPFLEMDRPEEQVRFWDTRLDTARLRLGLSVGFSAPGLALAYKREFRRALPHGFAGELRRRLRRGFGRHPNRTNPYAWRLMLGREPVGAEPPAVLRPGAITLACADAVDYLESVPAGAFGGFTLSNILDSVGPRTVARLRAAVRRAASAGARVVLRSFAPASDAAAEEWAARDRAFLWGSIRVVPAAEF